MATYQPDASGTVVLSGHEDLALAYKLKSSFATKLEAELDEMKARLRDVARTVVLATEGAVRVFFRDGQKGGVGVTQPDYSSVGNRLVLSDKKMSEIVKKADPSTLGIDAASLYEETVTEPGGEVIVLRGRWVAWFKQHMGQFLSATPPDPDILWETRERAVTRRLKADAISSLRALAALGNAMALSLLSAGTKEMIVKVEK